MYLYEILKGLDRWYPTMQGLIQFIINTTDQSYDVTHVEKTECLASGTLGGRNGQKHISNRYAQLERPAKV